MRVAVVGAGFAGLACAADLAPPGSTSRSSRRATASVAGCGPSHARRARFERGGEFVEAGYDHLRRRAAASACRSPRRASSSPRARCAPTAGSCRTCCTRPSTSSRRPRRPRCRGSGDLGGRRARARSARAAGAARAEPPARGHVHRRARPRVGGVARERRAAHGDVGEVASARLAGGNDALARALAAELGDRLRLGCAMRELHEEDEAVSIERHGLDERFDRAVLAVPLPLALALLPALRERAGYARLSSASRASCTCRWPSRRIRAPCRGSRRRSGRGRPAARRAGRRRSPRRSRAARRPTRRSSSRTAASAGSRAADAPARAAPAGDAVLTRWADERRRRVLRVPPARVVAADDEEVAAPHGRVHLAANIPRPSTGERSRGHCAAALAPPPVVAEREGTTNPY